MLSTGSPSAQDFSAGALMNRAADAPANQEAAAAAGAVLPLVVVLSFGTPPARANAAAALGNLAHGNAVNRRAVLDAQAVPPLLALLAAPPAPTPAAAGAKTSGGPVTSASAKGALPTDARAEAADCLRVLCDGDEVLQAVLAEEGALPSAAVMLGAGGDVADAAARLLKSFAECFDEAIDEATAKVKK